MGASVATFDDTMTDIIYELDDREIFNDIRSELKYMDTETIVDEEESSEYDWSYFYVSANLLPGGKRSKSRSPSNDALRWKLEGFSAVDITGSTPWPSYNNYTVEIISSSETSCTVEFENTGGSQCLIEGYLYYKYLYSYTPEVTHTESDLKRLMVRATDATSIKKYGRRVMDLTWPMGATQEQTQSLVNSYCTRYSEPIARVTMILKGSDDTLRVQMLTRKISEKITVISSDLGLNSDFFINKIDFRDNPDELVSLVWTLEEVRGTEAAGIFMIDTDSIDGSKLIG